MGKIKRAAFRALMPRLYHWQSFETKKNSFDGRIAALALPVMRVMGPFWSFGVQVPAVEPVDELSLPDDSLFALRLMQEHRIAVKEAEPGDPPDHELGNMHRPQFFRAVVEEFYSYDSLSSDNYFPKKPRKNRYPSASRLSIIGVNTLKGVEENINGTKLSETTPVTDGQKPGSNTSELLLATIGGNPGYKKGAKAYLPACQLIGGRISFSPTNEYLLKLRTQLGLTLDQSLPKDAQQGLVYLLPDGFALFGSLHVPWRNDKVSGWFKISSVPQQDISDSDAQALTVASPEQRKLDAEKTDNIAQMSVWNDAPHDIDESSHGWLVAMQQLRALLFSTGGPEWLRLSANGELDQRDLFWPLQPDEQFDFLLYRSVPVDHRVLVRESALAARLAERRPADAPLSVLTLKPSHFELFRQAASMVLVTSDNDKSKLNQSELQCAYTFEPGTEQLVINNGNPLELAVPLVDTAARLREAQETPPPKENNIDLLWTFVPVDVGWLHLPLPNVTLSSLDNVNVSEDLEQDNHKRIANAVSKANSTSGDVKKTSGAIGFENRPDVSGFVEDRRLWSFTLTDVDDAAMQVEFAIVENADQTQSKILNATVDLHGGSVLFDGALLLTPFRQTPERLIPDHAERALSSIGLLAVSPDLLRDVEAEVWELKKGDTPVMRCSLSVDALTFTPAKDTSQLSGGVNLITQIDTELLADPTSARAPWLWARQSSIPSIQTMPLALAGDARRQPSGSRELAPLRQLATEADKHPQAIHQNYRFEHALSMDVQTPHFKPEGEWQRPTNTDIAWIDEVGMTLLGLPSVTLFPGITVDKEQDRLMNHDINWSAGLDTPVSLEVRFDLAYRDEAFANSSLPKRLKTELAADSSLPKPPKVEESLEPESRVFEPRADNGPDSPSLTSQSENNSVWLGVWSGLQRDLSLSATEQNTMLVQSGGQTLLQGVFGDTVMPVETDFTGITWVNEEFDDGLHSFDEDGDQPWWLISLGQWSFTIAEFEPEVFTGLPSEDDLIGLNGQLENHRDEALAFGTAIIDADGDGFYDQRGLKANWAKYPAASNNLVSREVTINEVGAQQSANLMTAKTPYVETTGVLHFWFADVPMNADKTQILAAAKLSNANGEAGQDESDWKRHIVNASSFSNSALQGYRWWLSGASDADAADVIVAAGVQFQPLELRDMRFSEGKLERVEILGRPSLRLAGEPFEPRGTEGLALLVLTFNELQFDTEIVELPADPNNKLLWPLAKQAGFETPVPMLQLDHWPKTNTDVVLEEKRNGMVSVVLDGLFFEVPVFASFNEQKKLTLKVVYGEPLDALEQQLYVSNIDLNVSPLNTTQAMTLEAASLSITGSLRGTASNAVWMCKPVIVLDIQKPGLPALSATGVLKVPVFGELDIEAKVYEPDAEKPTLLMGLDHNGLIMEWQVAKNQTVVLENAFTASEFKGLLMVGLTNELAGKNDANPANVVSAVDTAIEQNFVERSLRLYVGTASLDASVSLSTVVSGIGESKNLQLRYDVSKFRLYGEMTHQNLFSWPDLTMPSDPEAGWSATTIPANLAATIQHSATVMFDGQPFHGFVNGVLTVAAQVLHRIDWDPQAADAAEKSKANSTWSMLQPIRFESVESVRTALLKDQSQQDASLANLSVLGVNKPDELAIEHLGAADKIFRHQASHHSDIRGYMRDIWLAQTEALTGVLVSLTTHHQLNWDFDAERGGRDWVLLSLPHLSVCTVDQWQMSPELEAVFKPTFDAELNLWLHGSDLPRPDALVPPEASVLADARTRLSNAMNKQVQVADVAGASVETVTKVHPGDAYAHALGLEVLLEPNGEPIPNNTRSVIQYYSLVKKADDVRLAALEYPAIHPACVLGVLKARGLDRTPQGYGLAQAGSAAGASSYVGDTDVKTLKVTLADFASRLSAHLVSVPLPRETLIENLDEKPAKAENRVARNGHHLTLHAISPDGRHIRVVTQRFSSSSDQKPSEPTPIAMAKPNTDLDRDLQWSSYTLLRLASWARHGSLIRESVDGTRNLFLLPQPNAQMMSPERDVRPIYSASVERGRVPQAQRVAPPNKIASAMPARLVPGYSAIASGAALWASDRVEDDGSITAGPKFSATASETVWQLHGGAEPFISKAGDSEINYRLHDRLQVSFREAHAWNGDDSRQRVTTALPDEYKSVIPAGLHPVANPVATPVTEQIPNEFKGIQNVIPGQTLTARLADRPGVWAESRLGLDAYGLHASERAINLRIPRPPILGQSDRTRSSSHEDGHHFASARPTLILHGPRVGRAGAGGVQALLNRQPRSAWATVLELSSPARGLITSQWDGKITFEAVASTGSENWQVKRAVAQVGEKRFTVTFSNNSYPTLDDDILAFINPDTGQTLKNEALSVRPATPVDMMLEVETTDNGGVTITRQLRFELLCAGTGLGMPEVPIYLRFDDPEYNDRLNGISRITSKELPEIVNPDSENLKEIVLAADRNDVRPTDRLELALGFIFDDNVVVDDDDELVVADRFLFKRIEGRAHLKDNAVRLKFDRQRTTDGVAIATELGEIDWPIGADATDVLSLSLDLQESLSLPEGSSEPLLMPKDELGISVLLANNFPFRMPFDVIDEPLLPANPSGFAQLQFNKKTLNEDNPKQTELSVSVPLYASSPPANLIEIVDPRDLLEGVVRRRAIYQWRSFVARSATVRNALQKVSASGSTWIETDLSEGWSVVEDPDEALEN